MALTTFVQLSYSLCTFLIVVAQATGGTDFGVGKPKPTCANTPCPENSICNDEYGYVSCECIKGKTGVNCSLDDPCLLNTTHCPADSVCYGDCNPNIVCEGATGFAHCRGCVAGWTGIQCLEDVDECADEIPACLNDGICRNSMGDFECICQTGWTGKQCDCQKGSKCDVEELSEEDQEAKPENGSSFTELSYISIVVLLLLNIWLSWNH